MRVLVTGHAGYIGPVVIRHLVASGAAVHGLDSYLFDFPPYGPPPPDVPSIERDIREVTVDDLAGFNAVIHLAALSNDPLGELSPGVTEEVNHEATVRLAEMARQAGVERFVFAASCSAYGASTPGEWLDEHAPLNPLTAYATSKVLAERDLADLNGADFVTVSMRNATAYGFSPIMRTDLVVNELVARAVMDGRVVLRTSGVQWRPLVHVDDIARAAVAAVEAPAEIVAGRAFNVGADSENYRIREVADLIADVVGDAEVIVANGAQSDRRDYRVKFGALADALPDAVPKWTLRDGIEQLVHAFRRYGVDEAMLARYTRLDHLRELIERGQVDEQVRRLETASRA